MKTHVRKGDEVEIISGQHKGKRGTVTSVNAAKSQVVVEGGRKITKATRRTEQGEGGLVEKDGPVHISNVKKLG